MRSVSASLQPLKKLSQFFKQIFRLYISDEEGNMIISTDRFGDDQQVVARGGEFVCLELNVSFI